MTDTATDQPPKAKRPRPHNFKVRLSETELATAKNNAQNAGKALATYARECLIKERIFNRKIHKDLAQYLGQIAYIGNNINQITRVLHYYNSHDLLDNTELTNLNLVLLQIQNDLSKISDNITALSYSQDEQ